ncbi:MAG: TATA-box-binding protein [Candidatus Lokiarchaeota archaeon]|nr:TATA-box-binding protein [Candidatus Lokiarchaeota archaeon]
MINQIQKNLPKETSKTPSISLKVENVVASVRLASYIELETLTSHFSDVEEKTNFPGLVIKIKKPKSTILLFRSGKVVITGTKSVKSIPLIVSKVRNRLIELCIELDAEPKIRVENIVSSGSFHMPINLDLISLTLERTIYEPEVFPGLIYKVEEPKVCFLIFSSGNIICTGAKNNKDIVTAVKDLAITLRDSGVLDDQESIEYI